jgi:hypothetical protein
MGHNWGDCYSNAYNKKRRNSNDEKDKQNKNKSTSFAVAVSASSNKDGDNNVEMNSGSEDEILNNTRKCFAPIQTFENSSSHHIDTCCPSFVQTESLQNVNNYSSFIMNAEIDGVLPCEEELINQHSDILLPLHDLRPIGLLLPRLIQLQKNSRAL